MAATRKKILFVITKASWGGAGRYVFDLATHLPSGKYEVIVALGGEGALKDALEEKGIKILSLSHLKRDVSLSGDLHSFKSLHKICRDESPDIIHINSSKAGALGALAARMAGVPRIIFTAHGWAFNEDRSALSKILIKIIHWVTVLLSHTTIAVSHKTKEQIRSLPFVAGKVAVVHNGMSSLQTLSKKEALDSIFNGTIPEDMNDETVLIGTISELHKNKGIDYLILAVKELNELIKSKSYTQSIPAFKVLIIGGGEEEHNLQELIKKHKLEHIVYLAGFKHNAQNLLSALDIFTLTSRTEALPYALLEAGLAGKTVLASAVGGIPEIITDMETGILIPPKNIHELTGALELLLTDDHTRKRMGIALKKHITRSFSIKKMLRNTERLYTKKKGGY